MVLLLAFLREIRMIGVDLKRKQTSFKFRGRLSITAIWYNIISA